jgi:molecular chaperone GrpE
MPDEQNDSASAKAMADKEEKINEELEEAKKQAEDNLNGWKREKADFINFQKEVMRQKEDWVKFSNRDLLSKVLPVMDGFDEAMKYAPKEKDEFTKGVEQIKKQFDEFLKNSGVERMSTDGEKFNPEIHESIGFEEKEGGESGTIARVVQIGYELNGKVLRPAKITIIK